MTVIRLLYNSVILMHHTGFVLACNNLQYSISRDAYIPETAVQACAHVLVATDLPTKHFFHQNVPQVNRLIISLSSSLNWTKV